MAKKDAIRKENSVLRILGAIFFGFLLGTFIRAIVAITTPNVLMKINGTSLEDAQLLASSSFLSSVLIGGITVFLTAMAAAFLAKKRGVLVGILANFVPISFWVLAFLYALTSGAEPVVLILSLPFLQFIVIVLASIFGGLCGEKCYSKERDLDINKYGPTIFGVNWLHYIWIAPLVFYPFVSAVVALVYSWLYTFSTDLYFVSNIDLWINVAWWFYFFINPLIIAILGILAVMAFLKFWQIMQYKQTYYTGWERFLRILFYGIIVPLLLKLIINFTILSTKNMFDPVIKNWKVGLAYILIIPIIGLFIWIVWWLKNKIIKKKK